MKEGQKGQKTAAREREKREGKQAKAEKKIKALALTERDALREAKAEQRKSKAQALAEQGALREAKAEKKKNKVQALAERDARRTPWENLSRTVDEYKALIRSGEKHMLAGLRDALQDRDVIIGPWQSEVGFEVLYWAPFVRWLATQQVFDPARAVLLTRGGAEVWYPGLFNRSVDIFSLVGVDEFKARNAERIRNSAIQKHIEIGEFDRELLAKATAAVGGGDSACLHPKEMYTYFHPLLSAKRGIAPLEIARRALNFGRLAPPSSAILKGRLPRSYVAVKFYFRSSLPDIPANREFVSKILDELAEQDDVVLLNTRLEFDEHVECQAVTRSRIHRIDDLVTAENNLAVQSEVIAFAKGFYGSYGGFSYIPLFYGVPSFAFRCSDDKVNWTHLHLANEVAIGFETPFHLIHTRDYPLLRNMMRMA